MLKRASLARLCLLFFLLIPTLFALDTSEPGVYWSAVMQLGYRSGERRVDRELAFRNVEEILRFSKQILGYFEVERKTREFIERIRTNLGSLDIDRIYEVMPYRHPGTAWHSLAFEGRRLRRKFLVVQTDPKLEEWLKHFSKDPFYLWSDMDRLGEFVFRLFVRPGEEGSFFVHTDVESCLWHLHYLQILRSLEELLRATERAAWLAYASYPKSFLRRCSLVHSMDRRVAFSFFRAFPRLFGEVGLFWDIQGIVRPRRIAQGSYLKVDLLLKPRLDSFELYYPRIFGVLEKLKGVIFLRSRLYDGDGNLVAMARFNTKDFVLRITFLLKGGKILRCKTAWIPRSLEGIDFLKMGEKKFRNILDLQLNIKGLRLLIRSLELKLSYALGSEGPRVRVQFNRPPQVSKVQGALYGFIPVWLIDLFIPSNLEEILRSFFLALTQGNGGKGFLAQARIVRGERYSYLRVLSEVEIIANGALKFVLSFQSKAGLTDPELYNEIRRFGMRFWHAFVADYFRYKYR